MRKIFKNRWFLGGLAVLMIALAVWFIGPAVALFDVRPLESVTARVAVIVAVLAIWLGIELGRMWAARQANKKLLEGIAGTDAEVDPSAEKSAEEIATLRKRFEEAATVLKKAKFEDRGGEKQYLYQLPWYVFIGAPGSGKTTALVNSGLHFPLGEGQDGHAVKGVGGTRNCDWWFTDEAVLLDTAGRYTTQESEQKVDSAAWLSFLDLLKRHRPRRPLNGAIITVSVSDLLSWGDAERARYADAVRQRIAELYTRLGVRFPLYVMVTKCDLLAGFNEFYATFGRDERSQVWGMTFPHTPEATAAADYGALYQAEFNGLESRLNGIVLERVQGERDQQRRALMYNFPQQLGGLRALLGEFVTQVFKGSRYAEQPMLRGIYFTSGTQEGSPIDRVLGTLARSFGLERKILPPSVSSGKSYFITRLLKDVVFPEAGLVGANAKLERKLRIALYAGYAVLGVVTIGLLTLWGVSYFRNQALVAEFETKTQAVKDKVDKLPPPQLGDLPAIGAVLTELKGLTEPYGAPGYSVPWSLGFGLYQGDKLASQAQRAYENALRDALLPRVALRIEQLIRNVGNPVGEYEWLKAYLMLYSDKVLDPKALASVVSLDWEQSMGSVDDGRLVKALQGHLATALAGRPITMTHRQNADLVKDARAKLASSSLTDRIVERLRREAELSDLPGFKLSEVAGPDTARVFQRLSRKPLTEGVSGYFTVNGYYKNFKPNAEKATQRLQEEEAWVLGQKSAPSAQILEEVRSRYLAEYIRAWDGFLGDVKPKSAENVAETLQIVRVLSGPDSPLKRLIVAAAKETALSEGDGTAKSTATKAATDAVVDTTKKVLGSLLGGAAAKVDVGPKRPEAVVDDHFRSLRMLAAAPEGGGAAPIDGVIAGLAELYTALQATEAQMREGGKPPVPPIVIRLKGDADRLPDVAKEIVKGSAAGAEAQIKGVASQNVVSGIDEAAAFCRKAVDGRYPFARAATSEVTVDDFAQVFSAGGDLDAFFQKELAQQIDRSGAVWRPRGADSGLAIAPAAIAQFQRAATIRDAFFRGGAKTPAAAAELALVSMDDRLTHVTLEVENQVLRFDRVASTPVKLTWPSQKAGGRVRLQAYPSGATLNAEGTWALFRLVERGNPQPSNQPDRLQLTYTLEGARVVFELRAQSVYNPFRLKAIEEFQCPRGK